MSQDNRFHQYGYDHYLKAPKREPQYTQRANEAHGLNGLRFRLPHKFQKPGPMTYGVLAAAVFFVGALVYFSTGSDTAKTQDVVIIQADKTPIKTYPQNRGGMDIPNRDSTILARIGQESALPDEPRMIENLLEREEVDLISKEDAIAQAMDSAPSDMVDGIEDTEIASAPELIEETAASSTEVENSDVIARAPDSNETYMEAPFELKEPEAPGAQDVLQKIGSTANDDEAESGVSDEFAQNVALAALKSKPEVTRTIHAAGTAPETLAFVRGVLGAESSDQHPANVEPAAGAATPAVRTLEGGVYYVQLASITDETRAGGEWAKMQSKYNVLKPSQYRVQQASINGTNFYRIQAGPMSKAEANRICESLKSSQKPGGCLVVR